MGAKPSSQRVKDDGVPDSGSVVARAQEGQASQFAVQPITAAIKAKGTNLVLEVDSLGFRLLKPGTLDALGAFGWGEIHSWLHSPGRFSFRYYDDRSQKIQECAFKIQQVDQLLASMEIFIEAVMSQRKADAITEADFEQLLTQLQQCDPADRTARIATAARFCFFTSSQGIKLMETVDNIFDKMDVAVALHHRLIDQTAFATLLRCLECQEDRDNVWHRILTSKSHKMPVMTVPQTRPSQ